MHAPSTTTRDFLDPPRLITGTFEDILGPIDFKDGMNTVCAGHHKDSGHEKTYCCTRFQQRLDLNETWSHKS